MRVRVDIQLNKETKPKPNDSQIIQIIFNME